MTTPASNPISLTNVAAELGISANGIELGQANVRTLAGVPSGPISLTNLLNKSAGTALSANATPTTVSGSCTGASTCTADSTSASCAAGGGTGTYTYLWQLVSGDSSITPVSSTSASTVFRRTNGATTGSPTVSAVYRCRVIDNNGAGTTVFSNSITINLTHSALSSLTANKSGDASGDCSAASGSCSATTNTVTITPSGGQAPYTYAWVRLSGSTTDAISSTTAQTVSWSRTNAVSGNPNLSAVWQCTVTDAASQTAQVSVNVSTQHEGTS